MQQFLKGAVVIWTAVLVLRCFNFEYAHVKEFTGHMSLIERLEVLYSLLLVLFKICKLKCS